MPQPPSRSSFHCMQRETVTSALAGSSSTLYGSVKISNTTRESGGTIVLLDTSELLTGRATVQINRSVLLANILQELVKILPRSLFPMRAPSSTTSQAWSFVRMRSMAITLTCPLMPTLPAELVSVYQRSRDASCSSETKRMYNAFGISKRRANISL